MSLSFPEIQTPEQEFQYLLEEAGMNEAFNGSSDEKYKDSIRESYYSMVSLTEAKSREQKLDLLKELLKQNDVIALHHAVGDSNLKRENKKSKAAGA